MIYYVSMKNHVVACLFAALLLPDPAAAESAAHVCNTAARINAACEHAAQDRQPFSITGVVAAAPTRHMTNLILTDATGTCCLYCPSNQVSRVGDVVRAAGFLVIDVGGNFVASVKQLEILGKAPVPNPVSTTIAEIASGRQDNRIVRVRGSVIDVSEDEIDSNFANVLLEHDGQMLAVTYYIEDDSMSQVRQLLDKDIELVGFCEPRMSSERRFHGRGIYTNLGDTKVISNAKSDPFDVPTLTLQQQTGPGIIFALGKRHVDGFVIARWGGKNFLLSTDDNRLVRVSTRDLQILPCVGDRVRAVGYPETDLFNINFSYAVWRHEPGGPPVAQPTNVIAISSVIPGNLARRFNPLWHGKLVQLTGRIREIVASEGRDGILLSCESETVKIDTSGCQRPLPGLMLDATVAVTGVCLMEIADWRPAAPFPHIRSFFIVPRSPDDIRVLKRPSWWTAKRLGIACLVLFAVTVGTLIWNRWLQKIVVRRSHELLRSEIAKASETLRVDERTRLAVELHDTLSQNLTAVSFQIAASASTLESSPHDAALLLSKADRMLKSCRTELKNCLFDLRGNALEDPDFTSAVRKTLVPFDCTAKISVRLNIPRAKCSDTTVHAILQVIRELVANAIRHGKAKHIRVAGGLGNGSVSFSVQDNGCGFDTNSASGIGAGHFGLTGVRERIKQLQGTFSLQSEPGKGVRAVIRLPLPHRKEGVAT